MHLRVSPRRPTMDRDKMKQCFYDILLKKTQKNNSAQMSTEKYNSLIEQVKMAKGRSKKITRDYWLLRHYDVLTIGGKEKLIKPVVNQQFLYYIPLEDIFDILYNTHVSIGHGGRDRMRKELQQCYKNITVNEVQLFLNLCEVCLQKRKTEKKDSAVVPKVLSQLDSRCQVDIIDYQAKADGDYKFIFIYQDHLTKFVILKPLKNEKPEEIARHILDIFLIFGAPTILQSEEGYKFCTSIIDCLKLMWPQLNIVSGQTSDYLNNGEGSLDLESMLITWMTENQCKNWTKALGFVQYTKNQTYHPRIKQTPYEAMFGQAAKVGLASSKWHSNIAGNITTEEDLVKVLDEGESESDKVEIEVPMANALSEDTSDTSYSIHEVKIESPDDDICTFTEEDFEKVLGEEEMSESNKAGSEVLIEKEMLNKNVGMSSTLFQHVKINKCKICGIKLESPEDNLCALCVQKMNDCHIKREAEESPESQTKRMKPVSDVDHSAVEMETTSTIANSQSIESEQGHARCFCTNKCWIGVCSCKSSGLMCNSYCHPNMQCYNKYYFM